MEKFEKAIIVRDYTSKDYFGMYSNPSLQRKIIKAGFYLFEDSDKPQLFVRKIDNPDDWITFFNSSDSVIKILEDDNVAIGEAIKMGIPTLRTTGLVTGWASHQQIVDNRPVLWETVFANYEINRMNNRQITN